MADENTEGSRKRKSTSDFAEPCGEKAAGNSGEGAEVPCGPSPKCPRTSIPQQTNLEIHSDTQTNCEDAAGINECRDETAQEVALLQADASEQVETDALCVSKKDESAETPNKDKATETPVKVNNLGEGDTEFVVKELKIDHKPDNDAQINCEDTAATNENEDETAQAESVNIVDEIPEMPLQANIPNNSNDGITADVVNTSAEELKNDDKLNDVKISESFNRYDILRDNPADDEDVETCGFPPIITITFSNGEPIENYKPKFLQFISRFTELRVVDLSNAIHLFNASAEDSMDASPTADNQTDISARNKKRKRKSKAKKELFTLDLNPSVTEAGDKMVKFSSKFKVLEEVAEEDDESKAAVHSMSKCFNCDGNHAMRDCIVPKDFAKIRMARQRFNSSAMRNSRYHLEEEQKFAHLAPGRISNKLREALGLGKYEVPQHVYKMRILGYPPGWLEEAKVVHSNISLFDIEGKNMMAKGGNKRSHIDVTRIIEYPGFNAKFEPGCRDQSYQYGVPPFSQAHSKEAMIKFVDKVYDTLEDDLEACDMDIDASSDKETIEEPPTQSRTSPTLTDLEIKKKQLLAQLVISDDSNSNAKSDKIENNGEISLSEENNSTLNNLITSTVPGTPILKSASPYLRLPKADNFSKDVSPVINFENLPNSTGKYEQMTGVLQKVRKTLKNIQEKT